MTIIQDSPAHSYEAMAAIFADLRNLKRACGKSKHDQIAVLISALLDEGIDTKPRIIGMLKKLDFTGEHIAKVLDEGIIAKRWRRYGFGQYRSASADLPSVSGVAFAQGS